MMMFIDYNWAWGGDNYDYEARIAAKMKQRAMNQKADDALFKELMTDMEDYGYMGERKFIRSRKILTYKGKIRFKKFEAGYEFWDPELVKLWNRMVKDKTEKDTKAIRVRKRTKSRVLYQYHKRKFRRLGRVMMPFSRAEKCATKAKKLNQFLTSGNKLYFYTRFYENTASPFGVKDPIYSRIKNFISLREHYKKYKDFYQPLRYTIVKNTPDFLFLCFCSLSVFVFFFFIVPLISFLFNAFLFKFSLFFLFFFKGLFIIISSAYFLLISFIIPILSPYVIVQLVPEFILLCGILTILLLRAHFYNICDVSFIKKLLKVAFKDGLSSLENKSLESRLFGNWVPAFRDVYVANLAWNIFFVSVFLAEIWMMFSSADYVFASSSSGKSTLSVVDERFIIGGINDVYFGNHFLFDSYTYYSRFLILAIALAFLVIFKNELELDPSMRKVEYIALIMCGVLFSLAMPSASSLISLFLVAEGLVMVMYILSSGSSDRNPPGEGSLKYAILNSISTVMFILGSVFILCVEDIYFVNLLNSDKIIIGLVLIALTFLFKLGAFPFQNWMADLYESTSPGVLAFFLLIPKLSIILTLINLSRLFFVKFPIFFFVFFLILGLLSFVVGSVLAASQTKLSRLLAYSSISQTGALLILLSFVLINPYFPVSLLLLFTVIYALVSVQTMSMMSNLRRGTLSESVLSQLKDVSFIKFLPQTVQTVFSTFIFNLSGLPPLIGWVLKAIIVFSALLLLFCNVNLLLVYDIYNLLIWLAVLVFILSLISVYYSIRIYKLSYEVQPIDSFFPMISRETSILSLSTLFMFCFLNFVGIFFVGYIFSWILFVIF